MYVSRKYNLPGNRIEKIKKKRVGRKGRKGKKEETKKKSRRGILKFDIFESTLSNQTEWVPTPLDNPGAPIFVPARFLSARPAPSSAIKRKARAKKKKKTPGEEKSL